jgi:DNA modification methylase
MKDQILIGDALEILKTLPDGIINTCVTSPPYFGLRDYGVDGQIGLEQGPEQFIQKLVEVFREVRRVLRDDGTLWVNIGDSYATMQRSGKKESPGVGAKQAMPPIRTKIRWGKGGGTNFWWRIPTEKYGDLKPKDLIGIPWMLAFALRADGWHLRQDTIWHKPNSMPESVKDRCTKAHEYIFLLSKSPKYYFDSEAIQEPSVSTHPSGNGFKRECRLSYKDKNGARGNDQPWQVKPTRNRRSVWSVNTKPFKEAHFATFPEKLVEPCILAGSPKGGLVLDPFFGAGTTGLVAKKLGRNYLGVEINPKYAQIASERIDKWLISNVLPVDHIFE